MGANHRMYPAPWTSIAGFCAHDWPPYRGQESLSTVAKDICEQYEIRDGDLLVGSSLGGMVGCEITRLRRIPALFLVGSALLKTEISWLVSALHPLARFAPLEWVRRSAGHIPSEVAAMFAETEPDFVRAMVEPIFRWDGGVAANTIVHRIHGRRDRIIPPPGGVDLLLDGGHLIAMTNVSECVRYVEERTSRKAS